VVKVSRLGGNDKVVTIGYLRKDRTFKWFCDVTSRCSDTSKYSIGCLVLHTRLTREKSGRSDDPNVCVWCLFPGFQGKTINHVDHQWLINPWLEAALPMIDFWSRTCTETPSPALLQDWLYMRKI